MLQHIVFPAKIAQSSKCNPYDEEEAIQAGSEAWIGKKDPTQEDLLNAMETARIGIPDCKNSRQRFVSNFVTSKFYMELTESLDLHLFCIRMSNWTI